MGYLSYGYKASKTPIGKKVVDTVKNIFTGGSSNKNVLRILPPLTVQKKHFDRFFEASPHCIYFLYFSSHKLVWPFRYKRAESWD